MECECNSCSKAVPVFGHFVLLVGLSKGLFGTASDKIAWLISHTRRRSRFCDFAACSSLSAFCRCGRWAEASRTPSVRQDYFAFCAYKLSKLSPKQGLKALHAIREEPALFLLGIMTWKTVVTLEKQYISWLLMPSLDYFEDLSSKMTLLTVFDHVINNLLSYSCAEQ